MPRLALTSIVTAMALALGATAFAKPPYLQIPPAPQPLPPQVQVKPYWPAPSPPKTLPYVPPVATPQPTLVPPGQFPGHDDRVTLGFLGHFHDGEGMFVDRVFPGSIAQRLGLEAGDVIVRVNNRRLDCEHDCHDALNGTSRIRLVVRDVRTGRTRPTQTVFLDDHGHGHGPVRLYSQQQSLSRPF